MNWLREPDGEPLPGYRLLEPIGTGGFGEVWKCTAPGGIFKAIKFVYGNLNALDGDDVRAVQEMKALERVKQVRHPFVLSIEQIQDVGGELLIVMELADKNLHECLIEYQENGHPGIPRDILLGLLDDAAIGLDHLIEKHNLQHLDVKPRNLFMLADRVKVADFGLVKTLERSSSSGLMGGVTPIYAAPRNLLEQDQQALRSVQPRDRVHRTADRHAAVRREEHSATRAPAHDGAAGSVDAARSRPTDSGTGSRERPG